MPPGAWLAELTLGEGPDADVRAGLTSSTPYRCTDKGLLPLSLPQYLELLDWSGRQIVAGKSGSIPDHLAPILERLHIAPQHWLDTVENFERLFGRAVGRAETVARRALASGYQWIRGLSSCATAFR